MDDAATMAAFGASEAACYKWPDDTPEARTCRAAFCEGSAWAANALSAKDTELQTAVRNLDNLAAEYGKRKAKIKELRETLNFYADEDNWRSDGRTVLSASNVIFDCGKRARAALAAGK